MMMTFTPNLDPRGELKKLLIFSPSLGGIRYTDRPGDVGNQIVRNFHFIKFGVVLPAGA